MHRKEILSIFLLANVEIHILANTDGQASKIPTYLVFVLWELSSGSVANN